MVTRRVRGIVASHTGIALAALLIPAVASASHNTVELVSTGPADGMPSYCCGPAYVSFDGTRAVFETRQQLVPEDADSTEDVYLRADGSTTLLTDSSVPSFLVGTSADDSRILIRTQAPLVPEDTDGFVGDLYEWANGTLSLASTGPAGVNASTAVIGGKISEDGSRIVFTTAEQLVSSDLDSSDDVYQRAGGVTTLLSAGAIGGNGAFGVTFFDHNRRDGSHVFFTTSEALDPADLDTTPDLYERVGGVTRLVSTGPTAGPGTAGGPWFEAATPDGAKVLYSTQEGLVAGDTDGLTDIYSRSGGVTTLESTGPNDQNLSFACAHATVEGPSCNSHTRVSDDGSRVFFVTGEALVSGDTDGRLDLYERSGGTATLLSTGPAGGNGPYPIIRDIFIGSAVLVSKSGDRAFFITDEGLVAEDTDTSRDIYERSNGVTARVSVAGGGNYLYAVSENGDRVFFSNSGLFERAGGQITTLGGGFYNGRPLTPSGDTLAIGSSSQLTAGDGDTFPDLHLVGIDRSYDTPLASTPLQFSIVPHLRQTISSTQCQARGGADSQHGPPLAFSSCNPPRLLPGTVARMGPESSGTGQLKALYGDLDPTNGDQADVNVVLSVSDVRTAAGLDYDPDTVNPDASLVIRLRVSDRAGGVSQDQPGTLKDFDFSVPIDCTATADPVLGSTCNEFTSVDSVAPGAIRERKSTTLQTFGLRLYDSGADATRGNSDDRWFAMGGIYIP